MGVIRHRTTVQMTTNIDGTFHRRKKILSKKYFTPKNKTYFFLRKNVPLNEIVGKIVSYQVEIKVNISENENKKIVFFN